MIYSVGLQSLAHGYCRQVQILTSNERLWKDIWQKGLLYFGDLWIVTVREHADIEDILLTGQVFVIDKDREFLNRARACLRNASVIEYWGDYEDISFDIDNSFLSLFSFC